MKRLLLFLLLLTCPGYAQEVTPLFRSEEPLSIRLNFSIKELKKNTNDTVYTASVLAYQTTAGTWDSVKIDLRARGHFRRANCSFPPLKVKIKKGQGDKTPFAGNKNLKLVVPCQSGKLYNDLIIKEHLAYQLYKEVTPYYFNTRLVNLSLTDGRGKSAKNHELTGLFIEDDDLVAKRLKAKTYASEKVHPMKLADTATIMQDFFQYMISNSDWSAVQSHNIVVFESKNQLIPVAYDFDMSGLVNAPYGQVSELVGTSNVRERVYRGFCRNPELFEYARSEYLRLEPVLLDVVTCFEGKLHPRDSADTRRYLGEFFSTLKSDKSFRENIVQKCRKF
ncbi:MAG: hypothetical protein HRU69_11090 [Flammeovirgaceae bacterium]|nr:MAG: hypothetical protein HRU69_11090 [Flammeovirgaceae bacterium]